ncbi:MAG: hypothetical protein VX331_07135, partial [Candidatus Thermoplasmatota archaeon]|nr:hypothetical protein [Candidatus Thermoplasmatota archaeon]
RPHTFFISGLPELEDFKATIENCKEQLLQSQMKYLVSRGFEKGLKNYIDYWAKRFYFNVKYEPKHTGIATKRTQLEISFKKTGQWFPSGLSAMDRKIWFSRHVIEKHNSGIRLTNAEREFYNCIGDRIIITRMNAVSSRLYTYLLELLVGYTGDLVPFKRLEQHQPTPSTDSILEKKNFLISNY